MQYLHSDVEAALIQVFEGKLDRLTDLGDDTVLYLFRDLRVQICFDHQATITISHCNGSSSFAGLCSDRLAELAAQVSESWRAGDVRRIAYERASLVRKWSGQQ